MLAGLLVQPKAKDEMANVADDAKALKKRIAELETTVKTQEQLIYILKQMPGIYEEKKNEKAHGGTQKSDRRLVGKRRGPRRSKSAVAKSQGKPEDAK